MVKARAVFAVDRARENLIAMSQRIHVRVKPGNLPGGIDHERMPGGELHHSHVGK